MTVQEWLAQVRAADDEIEILRRSVLDSWLQAVKVTQQMSAARVQQSGDVHRFDAVVELDEAVCERIRELSALKAQAVRLIARLPDPQQRQVLSAYYVDCRDVDGQRKTWEMVAVELRLSWRQTMYAKKAALAAMEKFCDRIAYAACDTVQAERCG